MCVSERELERRGERERESENELYHDFPCHLVSLYQLRRLEELEVHLPTLWRARHAIVVGESHSTNLTPHWTLELGMKTAVYTKLLTVWKTDIVDW